MQFIRNFSIIAHIDHGKSTLSDQLIYHCNGLKIREMTPQVLDSMDIERERGITIKAQVVTLKYTSKNGQIYTLNLVDTPGHVDFSYEVSRSLSACEGALLVIDSSQGVEAQTVANCHTATELGIKILPVLNKVDLPQSNPDSILNQIKDVIGIETKNTILASAKTGFGIINILEAIVDQIPEPRGSQYLPLQALIIDSWFDNYVGVIIIVRVINGVLKPGSKLFFMVTNSIYLCEKVGVFTPKIENRSFLIAGEIGFIIAGIKKLSDAKIGDTITNFEKPALKALPGFKEIKSRVFSSLYLMDGSEYKKLYESLEKLQLNDSALTFERETSQALGFGFRCGFLGLLHMEVVQERLEREFHMNLIMTFPSVKYEIEDWNGQTRIIENPSNFPKKNTIKEIREPIANVILFSPKEYIGPIMVLCNKKRGLQTDMTYHESRVRLSYEIPLSEIILDFFDKLKSISHGYASMDYEFLEFRATDIVKVDILINDNYIDALTTIMHRNNAQYRAKVLVSRICQLVPRQMYDITIQAMVNGRIIFRENIKALRKNVLAKCYGGDISRKKKLLEKQKIGKKRMKNIGNIEIPKEIFSAVLKVES